MIITVNNNYLIQQKPVDHSTGEVLLLFLGMDSIVKKYLDELQIEKVNINEIYAEYFSRLLEEKI
jgi:hypothetical protein